MGSKIYAKTRFSRSIIQKNLRAPHGRRGQSASRPARPGSHTRGRGPSLRREGPTERQRDPALRRSSRARMYNIQSACTYSAAARFQTIVAAVTPWPRHYRMALCMNTRLASAARHCVRRGAATSAIVEPATHRLTRSPRCDERPAAASEGADGWLPAAACTGGDAGGDADGDAGGGAGGGDGGVHSESLAAAAATSDRHVRPFDNRFECGAARNIWSQSDELSSTCKSPQKKWTHERALPMSAIQVKDKAGALIARHVRDARRI